MGNRKQPFGYRMTLGEITILPEEAPTVSGQRYPKWSALPAEKHGRS